VSVRGVPLFRLVVDLQSLVASYGPAGLFVVCFVSATVIPLSSEAAVYGALEYGMPASQVLIYASVGNCLAVAFNYLLGRWGSEAAHRKALESKWAKQALEYLETHGMWALLLSWLPFIGDPLTVVGGIIRMNFLRFALITFSLRILRYVILIWILNS
jgi:membrane protein YqaA with SNARE-associated domain